jgi:hypothetical protein
MAFPKQVKKHLPLIPQKFGVERREEMLEDITRHGTFLPKGVLHADLDRGFLDFVKDKLELVVDEKKVPLIDRIITNQNWMQFTQTWNFQDLDKNISLPFLAIVRTPEVKPGKYVGGKFNVPEKLRINYFTVPTWDGQRKGADVYKVPQPVAVDIVYNLKLFCNRMRENNEFNKIVMQTFASAQSYTQINGHYMPIMMEEVSDESVKDLEKRKYYIINYKLTLQGFLLDEEDFQVSPAISRYMTMFEVDTKIKTRRVEIEPPRPDNFDFDFTFLSGVTQLSEVFRYTADLKVVELQNLSSCYNFNYTATTNNTLNFVTCNSGPSIISGITSGNTGTVCVQGGTFPVFSNPTGATTNSTTSCGSAFSVYINGLYIGDDLDVIQVNDGDSLLIKVYKSLITQTSVIKTVAYFV